MRLLKGAMVLVAVFAACCQAAEFYVSPGGRDTNPGTKVRPFASPSAAQQAVRKLVAAGLRQNVTVYVAGGTYYLAEGLTFGPADSGTEKFSITYRASGGKTPVFVGGLPVTGFKKHKDNIYVASLPKGAKARVAMENGVRLVLARSPNEGYVGMHRYAGAGKFTYYQGQFEEFVGADVSDAYVNIWADNNWFNYLFGLKSVDTNARVITLEKEFQAKKHNRFYVMNVLGMLDKAGECQISASTGKFYIWPRKTPIESQQVAVATADYVIAIRGAQGKTVRNLHFDGLDLTLASEDVVYVTSAEDCSFRACRIENSWGRGLHVRGPATRITLADSEVRYTGFNAVEFKGLAIGQPYVNKGNLVENCHIHHCGILLGHAAGVRIEDSGDNRVLHNHIHDSPRYGTSVKSLTTRFISDPKIRQNRYEYLHSRNNLLAYNHIHHVCLDSEDTGAMQSWGPGRDNVYDHNLIHDIGKPNLLLVSGMYLDDATDYFTVTNNVVYNIFASGHCQVIYVKGIGNKIDNNVFIANAKCGAAMRNKQSVLSHSQHWTHNIIVMENPGAAIYQFDDWGRNRVAECDYNLYFKPAGGLRIAGRSPYRRSYEAWRGVFDKQSISADPMFVDPAKRDYSLKAGSPALKLGIKSIDISKAGLTDKFPKRLDRE